MNSLKEGVNKIICGDCLEVMAGMPDGCVDTVITDPPAGIAFMSKSWDSDRGGRDKWIDWLAEVMAECLRVTKPGGSLLCWSIPRTSHWTGMAIENAGWRIIDKIAHIFGSGFPKSHDISKAIDKAAPRRGMFAEFAQHLRKQLRASGKSHKDIAFNFLRKTGGLTGCVWNWVNGMNVPTPEQWKVLQPLLSLSDKFLPLIERVEAEREIIGRGKAGLTAGTIANFTGEKEFDLTAPATDLAKLWDGWGTALKPAREDWWLAYKPLDGTFAANAEKHGVAGLNIDGGRIEYQSDYDKSQATPQGKCTSKGIAAIGAQPDAGRQLERVGYDRPEQKGRWPANVILDEEAGAMLDEQSGERPAGGSVDADVPSRTGVNAYGDYGRVGWQGHGDSGGASRFFYCAKASRAERNRGLEGMGFMRHADRNKIDGAGGDNPRNRTNTPKQNHHPTVKPLAFMEYLCELTKTPPGGVVLDPFTGSGTTLIACVGTGRDFIGIEKEPEYVEIARRRLDKAIAEQKAGQRGLFERAGSLSSAASTEKRKE